MRFYHLVDFVAAIAQKIPAAIKRTSAISVAASYISSLEKRAADLGRSVTSWNRVYVWSLLVALVTGALTFWAQRQSILISGKLSGVKDDIGRIKDEKLQRDLKEKDDQISKTNERAAKLSKEAEEERLARVKIEERLGGWRLNPEGQKRLKDKLKPFATTPFDLFVDDSEYRFMEILDGILISSGWSRIAPKSNALFSLTLSGKAKIQVGSSGIQVVVAQQAWDKFKDASEALVRGLNSENIPAKGTIVTQGENADAIHIVIGKRE